MYNKIISTLKKNDSIVIFMHTNPDGDAIGSALALYGFLKKKNKQVHCFLPTQSNLYNSKFSFLPYLEAFENKQALARYDVAVAVDCSDAKRLSEENFKVFQKAKTKVAIDHHLSHEKFAQITLCQPDAASTTEVIYKLLKKYDEKNIDYDIALLLYTGLVTDSGSFSFSNTTYQSHIIAAQLLRYKIDVGFVSKKVLKDIPINLFHLRNRVLSKAQFHNDNKIAIINFDIEDFIKTNTTEFDTEGIINGILDINTVEIAISIATIKEKSYKISLRTKDKINAAEIAKSFGGGGHASAAGCRLYGYYEDIYNKILSIATEKLND